MHYQVLDDPVGNRDVKKMQRLIEHFCSFVNVKCFFLFSDKMGLFQTFWKFKSLWPASSNEKNSNGKHVPKNWKLIWVVRFSLYFRFGFEIGNHISYV